MGEGKKQWLSRCAASQLCQALKGYNNVCLFALTISFFVFVIVVFIGIENRSRARIF